MIQTTLKVSMIMIILVEMFSLPLYADDTPETKELRERIRALEERVQHGKPVPTSEHPWYERVAISGGLLAGLFGTFGYSEAAERLNQVGFDGVTDREEKERLDLSTSVDLFFEFPVGQQGIASTHLSIAKGDGVNPEMEDATGLIPFADDTERDLQDNNKLLEAWYEGTYYEGKLVTTVGILDGTVYIDENKAANDETEQFMNSAFYTNPLHGVPSYRPGIRITWAPVKGWYGTVLSIEGEDRATAQERLFARSGDRSTFYAAEIGTTFGLEGRGGNCRLYGWYDSTDYDRFDGTGKKNSRGFGVSVDGKVNDRLVLFARFGFGDADILEFDRFYSLGAALEQGRQTIGLAAALLPSSSKAETRLGSGAASIDLYEKSLLVIEVYDRLQLAEPVSVSPDLQYLRHPRGSGDLDGIVIAGVRVHVTF
jgi:carbohydrate-selective porin OprB